MERLGVQLDAFAFESLIRIMHIKSLYKSVESIIVLLQRLNSNAIGDRLQVGGV